MKNLLLFILLGLAVPTIAQKAPAPTRHELRGVVTYFFNDNYGYKPDVGAKAYIISEKAAKAEGIDVTSLEKYLANSWALDVTNLDPKSPEELAAANIATPLEPKAVAANNAIAGSASTKVATADGTGVFLKKLPSGRYIILMVSANQTRANLVDVSGRRILKRVTIAGEEAEIDIRFNL